MRGTLHLWKLGSLMSGGSFDELARAMTGNQAVFVPCMPPLLHQHLSVIMTAHHSVSCQRQGASADRLQQSAATHSNP